MPDAADPGRPAGMAGAASPCIGVCRMNGASGLCEGCWRSMEEIAAWGMASESEKRRILERVAQRRSKDGI